ncbi:PhnD/SsuA/transferrin family substrate-binding protein [Geopsychrobacter electrodiphilus]|uniref:PhnD/SsuA/transferrin family substrate-binding protein n=1 Tax=Geopsychrobacter electrodiphilus TaxID=225196 RepID=UPI000374E34C|nr:PhnD/SsuA/transferrin family substrate-binding protein [Geopsychrobacter electrodiphilus]
MQRHVVLVAALLLFLSLLGCESDPQNTGPQYGSNPVSTEISVYRFAVHPLHNPAKLIESYQPLIDYLNANLKGGQLKLEASRNYADFEKKYQAREPAFLLPNPWQSLQAIQSGYRVIAMAGDPLDFKGVFIIRKDSGITRPADLKGQTVSYPSPTALAACIMPQYFLYEHGIDINREITNTYVGSQESAIDNVYLKKSVAGVTWPPPWRAYQKSHPVEAAALKVAWETGPLINNSVMVRDDIPAAIQAQVQTMLIRLNETEEGRAILSGMETALFTPAVDQDYDVVRPFIARFERNVRKVETP